jgi:hypothetical protein
MRVLVTQYLSIVCLQIFCFVKSIFNFTVASMKRVIASILFVLYFTSSSGATFHLHFCMNELVSISLNEHKEGVDACSFCSMEKPGGDKCAMKTKDCCKDKKVEVKTDKDQRAAHLFDHTKTQFPEFVLVAYANGIIAPISSPIKICDKAPPGVRTLPDFIRNRVFRV